MDAVQTRETGRGILAKDIYRAEPVPSPSFELYRWKCSWQWCVISRVKSLVWCMKRGVYKFKFEFPFCSFRGEGTIFF